MDIASLLECCNYMSRGSLREKLSKWQRDISLIFPLSVQEHPKLLQAACCTFPLLSGNFFFFA